jgi:hypothetical protein
MLGAHKKSPNVPFGLNPPKEEVEETAEVANCSTDGAIISSALVQRKINRMVKSQHVMRNVARTLQHPKRTPKTPAFFRNSHPGKSPAACF